MKYCAVICELNPFHNGHEFIFRKALELTGCDGLIALMSGGFVQRAEPAVMSEYVRARIALRSGADAVIELPVVYATASGEIFARGAIDILNTISDITHLVMGVESSEFDLLRRIARIRADNDAKFSSAVAARLNEGLTYARALTRATSDMLPEYSASEIADILTRPNNILAISYAQALLSSGSGIVFTPVRRCDDPTRFASASDLRSDASQAVAENFMPEYAYAEWRAQGRHCLKKNLGPLILNALRTCRIEDIANAPDCAEGFEFKLKTLARSCANFEELLSAVPTSRFTRGRIMRICLHTLLGITKDMQHCGYASARLIGVRDESKNLLSVLPDSIVIGKRGETSVLPEHRSCFEAERRASDLWALLAGVPCDFYSKLIVI